MKMHSLVDFCLHKQTRPQTNKQMHARARTHTHTGAVLMTQYFGQSLQVPAAHAPTHQQTRFRVRRATLLWVRNLRALHGASVLQRASKTAYWAVLDCCASRLSAGWCSRVRRCSASSRYTVPTPARTLTLAWGSTAPSKQAPQAALPLEALRIHLLIGIVV